MTGVLARLVARVRTGLAVLGVMPAVQVALRVVLLACGGVALAVAQGGWSMPGGLVVLVGVAALLGTVAAPESIGAGLVIGAAALAWVFRFGLHAPVPAGGTVLLATLLYAFHTTAALLAGLPPLARIDPVVLVRWYVRAAGVLLAGVLGGVVALLAGRVTGGIAVDLLGLVGVVVLAAVPLLLTARSRPRD